MTLPANSPPDDEHVSDLIRLATTDVRIEQIRREIEDTVEASRIFGVPSPRGNQNAAYLLTLNDALASALVALQRQRADVLRAATDPLRLKLIEAVVMGTHYFDPDDTPKEVTQALEAAGLIAYYDGWHLTYDAQAMLLLTGSGDGTTSGTGEGTETP